MTNNLEKRLKEHNNGYEKTTKPYVPFTLIYTEKAKTRPEARIKEKYFKS
jgi:putative endonuclease